jgi:hypothetical protein
MRSSSALAFARWERADVAASREVLALCEIAAVLDAQPVSSKTMTTR